MIEVLFIGELTRLPSAEHIVSRTRKSDDRSTER
jgi:hypothetical protein